MHLKPPQGLGSWNRRKLRQLSVSPRPFFFERANNSVNVPDGG